MRLILCIGENGAPAAEGSSEAAGGQSSGAGSAVAAFVGEIHQAGPLILLHTLPALPTVTETLVLSSSYLGVFQVK